MAEVHPSRVMVLLFTDIVGSVDLKARVGNAHYTRLVTRHDEIVRGLVGAVEGADILVDTGDGFLARFDSASGAAATALRFQQALLEEPWDGEALRVRIGIHMGEVTEGELDDSGRPKVIGMPADLAARIMSLGLPNQILMSRQVFDDARQFLRHHPSRHSGGEPAELKWVAHGHYLFQGAEEPMSLFEVGVAGVSPLRAPPDGAKARRQVTAEEESLLGWRPGIGLEIPRRLGWIIDRRLGVGGFGEVWLAHQKRTKEPRVFKFCFDPQRLRSFKRELTLFRLLREVVGDREDIAKLYEVQLDHSPYFLESEFTRRGSLEQWAAEKGGIKAVSMQHRLDLLVRMARAVAAAHSVGILHKDLKPANILIYEDEDGAPRPRLADFGIGVLTDRTQLEEHHITVAGFTVSQLTENDSSRSGTRMYSPPETLTGQPFSMQGDVYSLGVLLYQLAVGDFSRPLATGWEQHIADPLLREDIARSTSGDPADRLASASDLAERLLRLPGRRRARRWQRITRWSFAASILLGLAVALGAVWLQKERGLRNRAEAAEKLAQRRLGEVQSERDRASEEQQRAEEAQQVAEVAQREVEQQLTEVLRFSDGLRVRELMEQADQLWPMHPDRIPAYQDWLQQAEELQARLPAQRSSLLRLLELARGETSEHLEGLPAPTEVGELAQDPELHWRYATSWELIQNLEALQRVFQDVQERLAFARSLPETLQEHQESWDDARFFLAESLSYGQLDLAPQLGLVPLGADPVSDLWEFCVVGSGSVPERDSASGELLLTPNTGLVLVLIPGDSFLMGSQDEHPGKDNYDPDAGGNEQVHRLHLDSFFLSKYEMTQGQWRRLTGDSPSFYGAQRVGEGVDHHPVEQVSATECSTVLGRLGLQLPTEAQWEYAVRAGTQTVFHSGDRAESLEGYANLADEGSAVHYSQDWEFEPGFHDGFVIHSPVGSLNPNDFGLHDMHGNVFEWCRDAYADYAVDPAPGDGLRVAASGQRTQALRGGSFGRPALHARAAIRHHKAPGERSRSLGLRPARPLHDLGN